jgi:hypothetical protein
MDKSALFDKLLEIFDKRLDPEYLDVWWIGKNLTISVSYRSTTVDRYYWTLRYIDSGRHHVGFRAAPRIGHLERVKRIFGYLTRMDQKWESVTYFPSGVGM